MPRGHPRCSRGVLELARAGQEVSRVDFGSLREHFGTYFGPHFELKNGSIFESFFGSTFGTPKRSILKPN